MIQFGNDKIKDIYHGSRKIKEVWYGNQLVYRSKPFNPVLYDNGVENIEFNKNNHWGSNLMFTKRSDSMFFDLKTQSYGFGLLQIATGDKINLRGYSSLKITWSGVGAYSDGYTAQVALHTEPWGDIDTGYVSKSSKTFGFSKTTTTISLPSTSNLPTHYVLVMAQIGTRVPVANASLTIYKIWLE